MLKLNQRLKLSVPVASKGYKSTICVPIEYSKLHRLIQAFDGRSKGSQMSKVSSGGKLRLWSDCVNTKTDVNIPVRTCQLIPYAGKSINGKS